MSCYYNIFEIFWICLNFIILVNKFISLGIPPLGYKTMICFLFAGVRIFSIFFNCAVLSIHSSTSVSD